MVLKAIHDTLEEIPETYRDLYTQKGERFELTAITGIKTQGDVDRVQGTLRAAQADKVALQEKLNVWGDLDHTETVAALDRMEELKQAAEGKLDDAAIDELANKRAAAMLKTQLSPVQRQVEDFEKRNAELMEVNTNLTQAASMRKVADKVDAALTKAKVVTEAREDAQFQARYIFEVRADDGAVVTRDGVGVTPGLNPEQWLAEIEPRKRLWYGESSGGGSKGSGPAASPFSGRNPFSDEHWNMVEQVKIYKDHGPERAEQYAKAAGTTVGGRRPKAKTS